MPQRAKVSRCWAFQEQDRFRLAETKRMRFAIEKAGIEQPFDVTGRHRTVGDALAARGNFDHRLEPEQAARAGANDFGVDLATAERPATIARSTSSEPTASAAASRGTKIRGRVMTVAPDR
jgi:hypothetical protein